MRDLIGHINAQASEQASAANTDFPADILLTKLDALIEEHCHRAGIFRLQLHEAGEESWLPDGVQFEPAQWAIKIDRHRLFSQPGSDICALVGDQLHAAEFTAALIGREAQLRAAAHAGKLLTNEQWLQAKHALARLCRIPVNRHLLQEVAAKSPLALTMACGDAPEALHNMEALHNTFQDAYLAPIKESLADNYRALAARLSAPADQPILPALPAPSHTTLLAQQEGNRPLFFRADRHCEQISLFIFLDQIEATSTGLALLRMNLSRHWTPLGYCLEIQQCDPHVCKLWLYRIRHMPAESGTPDRQNHLEQAIRNDAAALHANRETYLQDLLAGCRVVQIR